MGQNVVFQSALQMEPVLADVALEPSHPCVRQLVRLQHGRSLELGWAEVALERRVGRVNDHVRPQAARPEESLLADRALERLHVGVHQLVIAQRLPVEQLLLADSALERPSARVHLGLVHPQLVPLLEFEPAGNWLRFCGIEEPVSRSCSRFFLPSGVFFYPDRYRKKERCSEIPEIGGCSACIWTLWTSREDEGGPWVQTTLGQNIWKIGEYQSS